MGYLNFPDEWPMQLVIDARDRADSAIKCVATERLQGFHPPSAPYANPSPNLGRLDCTGTFKLKFIHDTFYAFSAVCVDTLGADATGGRREEAPLEDPSLEVGVASRACACKPTRDESAYEDAATSKGDSCDKEIDDSVEFLSKKSKRLRTRAKRGSRSVKLSDEQVEALVARVDGRFQGPGLFIFIVSAQTVQ